MNQSTNQPSANSPGSPSPAGSSAGAKPISVTLQPLSSPVIGSVRVPGSKSITNRAVICAAMASGESFLTGVLQSEDTEVMVQAWKDLGLELDWDLEACTLRIRGCGGAPPIPNGELFIANSGTSIRFLTAALAATKGQYRLDGVPRMRERPIADLIDGLKQIGANVKSDNKTNPHCPPVVIDGNGIRGGESEVVGGVSSQFLSGMMMAAPYASSPLTIRVKGELVSKPYVDMTAEVMTSFGVEVQSREDSSYLIDAPKKYVGCEYAIEPDASAASYFWAAAAITGGTVRVEGLTRNALQGDVGIAEVLGKMGCEVEYGENYIEVTGKPLRGIDIDMNSISDTVQTLAPVALFANGPTRIRGVAHNRHKETDRIGDLAKELRKVGGVVEEHEDGLTICPPSNDQSSLRGATLETYHDHRMAMSFALLGLRIPGVVILDPRCTNKTFPQYFEVLGELIGQQPAYQY